jgi:hypothetical protein
MTKVKTIIRFGDIEAGQTTTVKNDEAIFKFQNSTISIPLKFVDDNPQIFDITKTKPRKKKD